MSRAKKILFSGYLALGFLVLRIIYAFVFAGLWGNQVIFTLPELRLAGPFSHITLFGVVSLDGIVRNIELALPFAFSILFFGTLASFVSASSLQKFSHRFPPVRNLLNGVAIGLSALPALFEAARKVFEARKLRGEKRSRMLVPILERSVELANSIGLKLALKPGGTKIASSVKLRNLVVPDIGLGPIDFELSSGEIVVLSGATGSGKSTFLEAIAGVLGEYRGREQTGFVDYGSSGSLSLSEIAGFVRYIPQNPRELLWGFEVSDLLNRVPAQLAKELGIESLTSKNIQSLSEGEALKLLLAENLSLNPSILLLDEPYAPLDFESRLQLTKLLARLSRTGMAILVVEHQPEHTAGLEAIHLHLAEGRLQPGAHRPELVNVVRVPTVVGSEEVVVAKLQDIEFDRLLVRSPSITMNQGECTWLSGENGSGKTSLLKALNRGEGVEVYGKKPSDVHTLALVPENFDDFFVTDSLGAELKRADRVANQAAGFTLQTLESILPTTDISSWLGMHPRDLSRGTRLALAISMQLSHKPLALLIDEPFRGLDPIAREMMVESLRCVAETGCALLFASHEQNWSSALATRKLTIQNLELKESFEVRA